MRGLFEYLKAELSSKEFADRARMNEAAFSRKRKLSIKDIIGCLLSYRGKNIQKELDEYRISLNKCQVSRQAFSKARENIDPSAIRELSDKISIKIEESSVLQTYNGYRLIAIDGTYLHLPARKALKEHFGVFSKQNENDPVKALGVVAYDVLNKIVLWNDLYASKSCEKKIVFDAIRRIQQRKTTPNPLFLMDRGYPSYELLHTLQEQDLLYVMRVQESFLKEINAAEQQDQNVLIKRKHSATGVRVVNITLPSGKNEKLLTNLPDSFSVQDLYDLYAMRWGVETQYLHLKQRQELQCFSGHSVSAIYQDFYAAVLVENLCGICWVFQKTDLDRKMHRIYEYAPSVANILCNLKAVFFACFRSKYAFEHSIRALFDFRSFSRFAYQVRNDRSRMRPTYPHHILKKAF
ncbi:MAG: IS4 family transposase [Clostridia bacterium]|nr:IS4 family transposase [Clostridia bacterium]